MICLTNLRLWNSELMELSNEIKLVRCIEILTEKPLKFFLLHFFSMNHELNLFLYNVVVTWFCTSFQCQKRIAWLRQAFCVSFQCTKYILNLVKWTIIFNIWICYNFYQLVGHMQLLFFEVAVNLCRTVVTSGTWLYVPILYQWIMKLEQIRTKKI